MAVQFNELGDLEIGRIDVDGKFIPTGPFWYFCRFGDYYELTVEPWDTSLSITANETYCQGGQCKECQVQEFEWEIELK